MMALLRPPTKCATPFCNLPIDQHRRHRPNATRTSKLKTLQQAKAIRPCKNGLACVTCRTASKISKGCLCQGKSETDQAAMTGSLPAVMAASTSILCVSPAVASAADASNTQHTAVTQIIWDIADIDARTAGLLATILQPFLSVGILLMIIRIVLSWYPQIPGNKLPWSIVVKPTEPVLGPTRRAIQPVGGVDISPIIWVAVLSFLNEILLGPQGILNLLQRKIDIP